MDQVPEKEGETKERLKIIHQTLAKNQQRGAGGKFVKKGDSVSTLSADKVVSVSQNKKTPTLTGDDPPLLDMKVTNPITYFKNWWKKIIGNEGIVMKWSLKIKPLTAFLLIAFVVSGGITINLLNRLKDKTPIASYIPALGAEKAVKRIFSGYVQINQKGSNYLVTADEVVVLVEGSGVSLQPFAGKRVLVEGMYTDNNRTLVVEEINEVVASEGE